MSAERARRRREERESSVIGIAMRDTGVLERHEPGVSYTRDLPPKVPGRHRWIATATYVLPDDFADPEAAEQHLDHENLWFVGFGCIDCEQPWSSETHHARCGGETYIDPQARR